MATMSSHHHITTLNDVDRRPSLMSGSIITAISFFLLLAAVLFIPAGIRWQRGGLFLAVFIVYTVLSTVYLWRANPEIFIARSKIHKGTKSWDKIVLVFILASFLGVLVIPGFDTRYAWSNVPPWLTAVGYLLFSLGFAM